MEEVIAFDRICRICLRSRSHEGSLLLFRITESKSQKFEELTQTELPMNDQYPTKICPDCSDKLEKFYFYRSQLVQRQEQLHTMLTETACENEEVIHREMLEEYIENDGEESTSDGVEVEEELVEVITLPSVKNLPITADNDTIIRLIDEIEEKNQMILEFSNQPLNIRRQKVLKVQSAADRTEELKYEKQMPKLIMNPNESSVSKNSGLVIYASEKSCIICGQVFRSDFQLTRHRRSFHPLEEPVVCCTLVFNFYGDYKKHQSLKHPKTVECCFCGKILKSKKTYLVHKRSHQSISDRKFKCSYLTCEKSFNFKLHLDNHERTHSGEKPFKCLLCSSSFKQSYQLTLHTRKHEGIINNCAKCSLKLSSKSQVKKHELTCNGLEKEQENYSSDESSAELPTDEQ